MKAELKLQEIKGTHSSLNVPVCHIELTLILKSLSSDDVETQKIKFEITSNGFSDLRIISNNNINELRLFITWLDKEVGIKTKESNKERVRQFIKEKLEAHRTLNTAKTIG